MEQKDSSYGVCELFGVRVDVLFHSSVPVYGGTIFPYMKDNRGDALVTSLPVNGLRVMPP